RLALPSKTPGVGRCLRSVFFVCLDWRLLPGVCHPSPVRSLGGEKGTRSHHDIVLFPGIGRAGGTRGAGGPDPGAPWAVVSGIAATHIGLFPPSPHHPITPSPPRAAAVPARAGGDRRTTG